MLRKGEVRYESGTTPIDDTYTGQFSCTLQSYNDLIWLYITPYFISGIPKYAITSIRKVFDSVLLTVSPPVTTQGTIILGTGFVLVVLSFIFRNKKKAETKE